jgi:hypothetical protein
MSGSPFDGAHRWHRASNGHGHDCRAALPSETVSGDGPEPGGR